MLIDLFTKATIKSLITLKSEQENMAKESVEHKSVLTLNQKYFLRFDFIEQILVDEDNEKQCSAVMLDFSLDVARLLGFHRRPKHTSFAQAGKSYNMRIFGQILYKKLNPDIVETVNDPFCNSDAEEVEEAQSAEETKHPS